MGKAQVQIHTPPATAVGATQRSKQLERSGRPSPRQYAPSIALLVPRRPAVMERQWDWEPVDGRGSASSPTEWVLGHVLAHVRWMTLAALLFLSLAQPLIGRLGQPTWLLILGFAGYRVVISLLRQRVSWLRSPARTAVLDFVMVSVLYTLAASPGGPVFVLFLLITISASCTLPLRRGLICTGVALLVLVVISPTLPMWTAGPIAVRDLFARLTVVVLTNIGAALLMRQLQREHDIACEASDVAERRAEDMRQHEAFVVSVSHELRTPLTAVRAGLGMLDLSLSDRMREDEAHLLDTARRNSERLGLLVDDLLTYHQLEAHALRLESECLDLGDVARRAVNAVAPLLAEKGQSVTLELADELPLRGDARRIEHVLINLVANACKHTPTGTSIAIAGRVMRHEVLLMVSDDGPGIPDDARERVFDRFHQLNPLGSGAGLGLAIAKGVVALHGGRLWIESQTASGGGADAGPMPGTGTTFCVALPRLVAGEDHVTDIADCG